MARVTLFSNRKFLKLSARLQSEALALGHLEFMWHAANETGNPVLGDADDVEATSRWRGPRGELVAALLDCGSNGGAGFIALRQDGLYEIHDYWHHAPDYVRKRAKREESRREKGDELLADQSLTGQNGGHAASRDRSLTGQTAHDRSLTGQNGDFQDSQSGVGRTPAPAPAPAREDEDSPRGRGAPVADATTVTSAEPKNAFALNGSGHEKQRSRVDLELEEQILAAYRELLPGLPQVRVWDDRRRKKLAARIRERVKDGKSADDVAYWRELFRRVAESDFLCGRSSDWRCHGLEWLIEPRHFVKLIEGAYDNASRSNGGGRGR
ncbi:MAG TPA: hypothetical protein VE907_19725 [Gammaproteobacteria bacterium]|nr:hypothetical protein [Gammaproteobacteria bacterium]